MEHLDRPRGVALVLSDLGLGTDLSMPSYTLDKTDLAKPNVSPKAASAPKAGKEGGSKQSRNLSAEAAADRVAAKKEEKLAAKAAVKAAAEERKATAAAERAAVVAAAKAKAAAE